MQKRPKVIFAAMVVLLAASAVLTFTVFKTQPPADKKVSLSATHPNVIQDSFDQITSTAADIRHTLNLKKQIDSLSSRKVWNHQDSLTLENDLDQLRKLNQASKP